MTFDEFVELPYALSALAFASGLLVGSFLNVVILRLPKRLQWEWECGCRELLSVDADSSPPPPGIVVESSRCPKCGHRLAPWENIPLLSFALLRGRCRGCGTAISWQYPLVELLTALLFAAVVARFGLTAQAGLALIFTAMLIALSGIDLHTTLLPDDLTYPLLWLGLLSSLYPVFASPSSAILGAAAGYLSLWTVYWGFKWVTGREGMGYGDFKLLAAVGAFCGPLAILPVLLISSFVGAIVGSIWIFAQGRGRGAQIPFGPYLAAAGWIQLMWGQSILDAYLSLSGIN